METIPPFCIHQPTFKEFEQRRYTGSPYPDVVSSKHAIIIRCQYLPSFDVTVRPLKPTPGPFDVHVISPQNPDNLSEVYFLKEV